jgi:PHD/YefM family antitoxin component YafN of YafNO toxin-antitoxin module
MNRTNADDFRSNLKNWMEAALKEPIKITRKNGDAFVLLNSDQFEKIQIELASLRGVAQGLSEVVQGKVRKASGESTESALEKAKKLVLGKTAKKAAG